MMQDNIASCVPCAFVELVKLSDDHAKRCDFAQYVFIANSAVCIIFTQLFCKLLCKLFCSSYMISIYLQSVIHHFADLFGTNIITSSQLAC